MPEYRELRNRTRISSTIENDVYKKLKQYSKESDIPVSKILDRAITMYLKNVNKQN